MSHFEQKEEEDEQYDQFEEDDEYQDNDQDNEEMDDGMEEEDNADALVQQQREGEVSGSNSKEAFDKIQVNNNFQIPGMGMAPLMYGSQQHQQQQDQDAVGFRPQSAKQFQNNQNQNVWVGNPQQMMYQQNEGYGPMMQMDQNMQQRQVGPYPGIQPPNQYIGPGFFIHNQGQNQNMMGGRGSVGVAKKRPFTAGKRHNLQFAVTKKNNAQKNPLILDQEVSRMRPRVVNQDRERLYDDAMKQKITANFLKDENIRLKTRVHILESELVKKEKLIDDLLLQQDNFQLIAPPQHPSAAPQTTKSVLATKMKFDSHLTLNLKRKIKELQSEIAVKDEENDKLKKNIKNTKIAEMEVEMKMYMDECTRLRHQLEEVIKSKDTFADPDQLKIIEDKFQQQEAIINSIKVQNGELTIAFQTKEQESQQLSQMLMEMEKKLRKALSLGKESAKLKRVNKEKEKESKFLKGENGMIKVQNDELRLKLEEMMKRQNKTPLNQIMASSTTGGFHGQIESGGEGAKLKKELQEKEEKLQEAKGVVSQLQAKLQEKIAEITHEQQEKNRFKKLYEDYLNKVAFLEVQLEEQGVDMQKLEKQMPKSGSEKMIQQQEKKKTPSPQKAKGEKVTNVDLKFLFDTFLNLKLKLQSKGIASSDISMLLFEKYNPEGLVSIKELSEQIISEGINPKNSLLLARYLIEPKNQAKLDYNEDLQNKQKFIVEQLEEQIGQYSLYNDQGYISRLNSKVKQVLQSCKETLKETLQLEDYEEEGVLAIGAIKESFVTLDLEIDEELMDYLMFVIYQKSESVEKMNYNAIFDLLEGKIPEPTAAGPKKRNRPESSSPPKLKDRNKEKFEKEESENYEDEFEQLVSHEGEEEDQKKMETMQVKDEKEEGEEDDDDYIDEEEMLDVAEKCFYRIAQEIINRNYNTKKAFGKHIVIEDIEGMNLELLSPVGFLEGIKDLGIVDLEEVEVACLMRVLTKPNLENAILLKELQVIMENFGIYDDDDEEELGESQPEVDTLGGKKEQEGSQSQTPDPDTKEEKKKKKKKAQGKVDLSQLDEKSIKTLAKLMLALIELEVSLYDFFDGAIYEQMVKTKTKENKIELINSKDFFEYLQKRGVRKKANEHENLKKFLQLDNNYPHLLQFKRLVKALDEMAKNEDLMAEIQAAALDEYPGEGMEGGVGDIEQNAENEGQPRLKTIGEDGDEEKHLDTKHDAGLPKVQANYPQEIEDDDQYEDDQQQFDNFEEKEEDYEF